MILFLPFKIRISCSVAFCAEFYSDRCEGQNVDKNLILMPFISHNKKGVNIQSTNSNIFRYVLSFLHMFFLFCAVQYK